MPNDNIMGIPTRACINGLTKEDTDRLKNALIKKIEDDETTVDITEDGKIILANENNLFLSFDGNILGITKDSSGDYIPWAVPYLPEDENENPIVPPNDTIMTSANIGVDPRIVHTFGNETIFGAKSYKQQIIGMNSIKINDSSNVGTNGQYKSIIKINKSKLKGVRTHTLFYVISRQGSTPFDFIALYTNYSNLISIAMNLRGNQSNYTYILSEDENYGYISILCTSSLLDTVQSGVLFSTDSNFNTEAFMINSQTTTDTLLGTEIMRLTP